MTTIGKAVEILELPAPRLPQVAKLVAEIAEHKGFDRCTWENLPIKLAFVMTEIDEALRELDVFPAPGLPAEMADIAIRTLAVLGTLWPDSWNSSRIEGEGTQRSQVPNPHREPAVLFRPINGHLCKAIGYWRNDNKVDTMQCLEFALLDLYRLADAYGIDLDDAIYTKCIKNIDRPYRHGKKRSEA